ncbi:M20 family metallo-hydrolase [Gordonia sp. NB41Y]|uniref:M20 family metallo-hydrolase n=1 Tax=Gordonia sp. NB41Y TaxID=875808 RepID=UPI0006B20559|nr:M20 family metallo-hydrolase [Gordonia sp. NB41Y]EMP14666.2 peptidase M20 [Gordonia sp. NB41Y]WLP90801.1 M20 family metallo-hydrolase [Gordonia sp. NB41Y]
MTIETGERGVHVPARADDRQAFLDDFARMSTFGATTAGGVDREAATDADAAQRKWLAAWLTERGFQVRFDRIGNMFGLLELVPGAPFVLAGSHMDSQPRGGRFDGAYGVLAAAHAFDRLRRLYTDPSCPTRPAYNLAVVNWFNEEGSRFTPSMQGSGVFTGKLDLADALATADAAGVTVQDALGAHSMLGDDVFPLDDAGRFRDDRVTAYAEIHIEQGRELDKAGVTIGVVPSTWGANKYEIGVVGWQGHTGATPITDRQDALYGAARIVVALRELAETYGDELHTSCGQLTVYPNSPVVVPREVHMHLDLRSSSDDILAAADRDLTRMFAEIEIAADVRIEKRFAHTWKGHDYPAGGVELAEAVVGDLGFRSMRVRTRAGHDSTNMKDLVPTVMLFIPSVDGVSHAENEYTADDDMLDGVTVLTETLARMVEGVLAGSASPGSAPPGSAPPGSASPGSD